MEIMGYIAALIIGISLGLIGGGGSILTLPVLVYLFGVSPLVATSYSLFIVGSTSLVGSFNSIRHGWIDVKTASLFGLSSIVTVFITRKIIVPIIPPQFSVAGFNISFSILTLILFAALMIVASVSMLKKSDQTSASLKSTSSFVTLSTYGVATGLITGFLGAGGGFLLIPALVLVLRLPMKTAIGTSLLIIALNSLVGFVADAGHYETNWDLLIAVSSIAIAGVFIGELLSRKIDGERLKKAFGWFVLVMGIFIIIREAF